MKAVEKGKLLLSSQRVEACSFQKSETLGVLYFTGIVRAAMNKKVSYNYKISVESDSGEVLNSQCECPAGKGPHGTSESLPRRGKRKVCLEDPRPLKYRKMEGYEDHVRNVTLNYCAKTSWDITLRFLYQKARLDLAVLDHDYLSLPFTEYWVDRHLEVTQATVRKLEELTRNQSRCREWFDERQWRLTASRFGHVCKATWRRDKQKLCESIVNPPDLHNKAVLHGHAFEPKAIKKFEERLNVKVSKCGLFVSQQYPYLAATPDGIIDFDHIEVKCPFKGRESQVLPGPNFPFLQYNNGQIERKPNHNYYYQIQGQLYITGRNFCYLVVHTKTDLWIQNICIDIEYCRNSMIPKLSLFWAKHLGSYVASTL